MANRNAEDDFDVRKEKGPEAEEQLSSKSQQRTGDDNQLAVLDAVADLRFADDFAEYMALPSS